jgi:hypothetical protein
VVNSAALLVLGEWQEDVKLKCKKAAPAVAGLQPLRVTRPTSRTAVTISDCGFRNAAPNHARGISGRDGARARRMAEGASKSP